MDVMTNRDLIIFLVGTLTALAALYLACRRGWV